MRTQVHTVPPEEICPHAQGATVQTRVCAVAYCYALELNIMFHLLILRIRYKKQSKKRKDPVGWNQNFQSWVPDWPPCVRTLLRHLAELGRKSNSYQ